MIPVYLTLWFGYELLLCHLYATRMYSYIICISLICSGVHGKTADEWHTDGIQIHKSDIRMKYKYIEMTSICHSYVLVCYAYVTSMSLLCHLYVTHMCLYLLVCHAYFTHMYLYVIRMSFLCTCMSPVCHSYVLVCHRYVTRMYFYVICMSLVCGFTMNLWRSWWKSCNFT